MHSPHALPQYSISYRSALCLVHTLPIVFTPPSLYTMPSPHAVPQYSTIQRSAIRIVHTLSHSIQSPIALPYARSKRCPTVLTPPLLYLMLGPHAVPHYSLINRSAVIPVHMITHSIHSHIALPYAQSTRCPQYSLSHRCALYPVHTLPYSIQSSIALPYANSKRCPTVFTPPSLCPMPYAQSTRCPKVFNPPSLCPNASPHAAP
jgi:hypothetical protein